ncbi:MAG TPA: hypothetical protein VMB79_12985 [Jatrophihabitans sp.]|nr:hypothetical protein [Jatrophihabitans sp.]
MSMAKGVSPALLLGVLRSVGAAAFLAPGAGAKTFGIPADGEGKYLVRLFAARNVALTAGLLASRGNARRLWYQAGIACDVLDLGAGLIGFAEGKKRSSATVDTAASLLATAFGVAGLLRDRAGR